MSARLWVSLIGLITLSHIASAAKLLVIGDTLDVKVTHSHFLQSLSSRGHQVVVKSAGDKTLRLREWDEWLYDGIVLFAPSASGDCPKPCIWFICYRVIFK